VFFYGDRAGIGRGSVSAFSNLFRYYLLHQMGGWWVDADVVCLSECVPATPIFMGWEYEQHLSGPRSSNSERHIHAGAPRHGRTRRNRPDGETDPTDANTRERGMLD
jgi:hypothetical protein